MSKKTYILSDLHLGAPHAAQSREREKHVARWLRHIAPHADSIYLVGDIFDFWFEYKKAVPKGFVRFLGTLGDIADMGVPLHLFTGNHDLWLKDYLEQEIQAHIYTKPVIHSLYGRRYYIAHGDGLGPGDHGYKLMKRVFTHPLNQWLFRLLHPDLGIGLAHKVSAKQNSDSDYFAKQREEDHLGDQEFLYVHSREMYAQHPDIEAFVYGHRHLLTDDALTNGPRVIYLGDWIRYFSYLEVSESGAELKLYLPGM
ncbi:MAG: UDP-2,3-diacylglucosamine diphosphatase, partial [Bacteroidetes bacterium]